jgi:two-component system NtrC family sensor kinase
MSISSQSEVLIQEVKRHANQLSETIKKSTHDEMLANSRDQLLSLLGQVSEEPSIRQIRIFNKAGEIVYSNDTLEIGNLVSKSSESCITCHAQDIPLKDIPHSERSRIYRIHLDSSRVIGIINLIYNEQSCWSADCHAHNPEDNILGVLDISVDLSSIDTQIANSELLIVILAIVSVLSLGVIISIFLRTLVVRPVKTIIDATQKIAGGNLSHRINSTSNDELGVLASSFDDMTQRLSEMRQQLFQSDKMASLGQLAAGVAHEINNPLTGVLTYSSYLLKQAKDNPELAADLNVIVRETKRSREIVKQLLDFSRQSVPKKVKCNVNQIIDRVVTIVHNELKFNKINLRQDLKEDLPDIIVDPNQIQQVLLNLIVNSIDALKNEHPQITIATNLISLPAYGIVKVKEALCPHGHNLIDHSHKIEGLPSIKLVAKLGANVGFIHLDSIYGSQHHHYGIPAMKEKSFKLYCPQCDVSMMDENQKCPECATSCYRIIIPNKGELIGCARYGGTWQKWEYMDKKGESEYLLLTLSDNGTGIPDQLLDKIFDPFFSTKGQKGTGLGLSVVWGIIENHGGRIELKSAENKGTTFTIKLPISNNHMMDW